MIDAPIALADDEKQLLMLLAERHIARATAMLEKHPDLARRNIMVAAAVGDADEVRAMLDAGADPNAYVLHDVDHGAHAARIPVMYFACVLNHTEVVRALLERGANPTDGESVYHAAEHNHRDCLELLLAHGANISDAHGEYGNTPLYFLTGYPSTHPRFANVVLGMQWLLEHGADPNVASNVGRQRDGSDGSGEMPLHRAASHKEYVEVARLLVQHGANVDAPRADGRAPYALAVREGRAEMAEYLASAGADTTRVTVVDRFLGACVRGDVVTARGLAAEHPGLMASLSRDDRNAIVAPVADGRVSSVELMLSLGWSLTEESVWGGTPLHWAAWHGRDAVVRMLLGKGAPVNVRDSTYGSSPIAWASHGSMNSRPGHDEDYLAVVDQLLDAGSTRAESFNREDDSPESLASPAVAERLRERGFTT
jgi:ankyrin repeat protein